MAATTNKPAFKTGAFWAVLVLTNIGFLMGSGLVIEGVAAQGIGWIVTVLSALGYRSWGPQPPQLPPAE